MNGIIALHIASAILFILSAGMNFASGNKGLGILWSICALANALLVTYYIGFPK